MQTLSDYVDFIAVSMGIHLSEKKIAAITKWLIKNEKYFEMVRELEDVILEVDKK